MGRRRGKYTTSLSYNIERHQRKTPSHPPKSGGDNEYLDSAPTFCLFVLISDAKFFMWLFWDGKYLPTIPYMSFLSNLLEAFGGAVVVVDNM